MSGKKTLFKPWVSAFSILLMISSSLSAADFDHQHTGFTELLQRHLKVLNNGQASQVDYEAFKQDRKKLQSYLENISAVTEKEFSSFIREQQKAFLINAYNAFTIELILTRYPDVESIKDLGTLFKNPWELKFVALLGDTISLDDIEHGRLRKPGRYNDPRIHFAVNCASIGCPSLREEAYTATDLEQQLDDQIKRFLSDRSRNTYDQKNNELNVSKIFKWYGEDFQKGDLGIESLEQFFANYAEQLTDSNTGQAMIRAKEADIKFLDYDWSLNDKK